MSDLETPPWMQGWKPAPPPEGVVTSVGNPLWFKGMNSPNPNGRPRGITDKKAKLVQRMLDDAEGIVDAIIAKALEGDSNSASLILSRVLPSIKAQAEKVQFVLMRMHLSASRLKWSLPLSLTVLSRPM
jgi:hypothetical protein